MAKEKIVAKKLVKKRSKRRGSLVPSGEQLIEELKRKHGTKVVDKALEDQNLDIPLSDMGLMDSVQKITARNPSRLAKDMKQGPQKDIRR